MRHGCRSTATQPYDTCIADEAKQEYLLAAVHDGDSLDRLVAQPIDDPVALMAHLVEMQIRGFRHRQTAVRKLRQVADGVQHSFYKGVCVSGGVLRNVAADTLVIQQRP